MSPTVGTRLHTPSVASVVLVEGSALVKSSSYPTPTSYGQHEGG